MSRFEMVESACPECGNATIDWDSDSLSVLCGDHEVLVHGSCPRCWAGITAAFRISAPNLTVYKHSKIKLNLPALGADDAGEECRQRVKRLFERYHASLIKTRHHANGGQGADLDWDDWEFTVNGVQYTISEWDYSNQFTPDKCTAEFIAFIQPGAHKPPEILLQFLKRLGRILFKYKAALNGYGQPFLLPPGADIKATWDVRR